MAKKMVVFVLIIATLCALSLRTYAAEELTATEDSKVVNQDIVSKIDPTGTGVVFRIYSISLRFGFAYYNNIDEILASSYLLEVLYAKKSNGEYTYWRYKDNECKQANRIKVNSRAMKMLETDEVIGYIGSDVIVYNTYYLSGETSHRGSAIYYKTNKGDYVYYSHYTAGEMLFPVEDFCAFQKAILQEISQNQSPDMVGDVDIRQVWDLSPYDFRNLNENEQDDKEPKPDMTDPDTPVLPKEEVDTPVTPAPPDQDVGDPVTPEPPKEDVGDPVTPEPPKEDVGDPVTPEPPKEDVDDPVIPESPKEDVSAPVTPDPPKEDVDNPIIPEPPKEDVSDPVVPELPKEDVDDQSATDPSAEVPIGTDKVQSKENNDIKEGNGWMVAVVGACILIAGIAGCIIFWRKRKM